MKDEAYISAVLQLGLRKSRRRLLFELSRLFDNVDLRGKAVLEVGGGAGVYSFAAEYLGAASVICLEPHRDGSSDTAIALFPELKRRIGSRAVCLEPVCIQEFDPGDRKFDVILSHNSINHLDERACIDLLRDERSWDAYEGLARRLYSMTSVGGDIIICDCGNRNFFYDFGVVNPIARSISWEKHQQPRTWAHVFENAGYSNPSISWNSFNSFGWLGQFFLGNAVAAYFLNSHFCLRMKKAPDTDAEDYSRSHRLRE
jgi:SAM-dependent methyltransferase